jgi:hypothetical protein
VFNLYNPTVFRTPTPVALFFDVRVQMVYVYVSAVLAKLAMLEDMLMSVPIIFVAAPPILHWPAASNTLTSCAQVDTEPGFVAAS